MVILRDLTGIEVYRKTFDRLSSLGSIKDALRNHTELLGRSFEIVGEDSFVLDGLDSEVLELNVCFPNFVGIAIEALMEIEQMLLSLSRLRGAAAESYVSTVNAHFEMRAAAAFPERTPLFKLYMKHDISESEMEHESSRFEFPACAYEVRQFACTDFLFWSLESPELGMWAAKLWAVTEPVWDIFALTSDIWDPSSATLCLLRSGRRRDPCRGGYKKLSERG